MFQGSFSFGALDPLIDRIRDLPAFVVCGALIVMIWMLWVFWKWASERIVTRVSNDRVRRTLRRNTSSAQVEVSLSRWASAPSPNRIIRSLEERSGRSNSKLNVGTAAKKAGADAPAQLDISPQPADGHSEPRIA